MNWAEEKFVKVFTRDTPTWLAWPWQARALAPLLMRKLEGDGRLAVGRLELARAVALTVGLPVEVVETGLAAMLDDGTLEAREDGLWWPKYEEAQESRKSDALNSRDYRARQRRESSRPTRQTPSDAVRPRQPPEQNRPEQTRTEKISAPRKKRADAVPTDPRHAPLVKTLVATFQRVAGVPYPFTPRDAKAVSQLLALGLEPTIDATWARALAATGYPLVRTLSELVMHFAHYATARRDGPDPNTGIAERPFVACSICSQGSVGIYASIRVCGRHYAQAQDESRRIDPVKPWAVDLSQWAQSQRNEGAAA